MGQYYYAVSSLPFLDFGTEPAIKSDEFLDICSRAVSRKDFEVICTASLNKLTGMDLNLPLLGRWLSWEGTLRNELAKLRGVSLGVEPGAYLYDIDSNTEAPGAARNAYKMDSPLAAEEFLNQARWLFLDELEMGHHFDLEKLIIYSLRLQILERKSMFTSKNGNESFQKIYENIKEAVREA